MLIPFFRRIRRHVFSCSGLKFCPSVSFSAVWPPLYKRTCGHFSSCHCKLLVNTIFFPSQSHGSDSVHLLMWTRWRHLTEVRSLERREKRGLEVTLNVADAAVWCRWRVAALPVFHKLPLCCWDSHRVRTISRVCRENGDDVQRAAAGWRKMLRWCPRSEWATCWRR